MHGKETYESVEATRARQNSLLLLNKFAYLQRSGCWYDCVIFLNFERQQDNRLFVTDFLRENRLNISREIYSILVSKYLHLVCHFAVPLGSIQEVPATSCQEIKASEGASAVSGNYWLDSIKPSQVILVFCELRIAGEVL